MSNQSSIMTKKRRVQHFTQAKQQGDKFTVVTAYDYPTAVAVDQSGADIVLVGDSLGMVALGLDSTIPVTMDMMVHHAAAVRRGVSKALVTADLPFLSYHVNRETTVRNAGRLIQEGGAEAVKLEGGVEVIDSVKAVLDAGIPVMGHIGLLPQSVNKLGGYRVQGRSDEDAESLLADARALQDAGVFSVVLEAIPADLAKVITKNLDIPTIGIGAGKHCDGQVLVLSDLLGMLPGAVPKFVKSYINLADAMRVAISAYCEEVRKGNFPQDQHEY